MRLYIYFLRKEFEYLISGGATNEVTLFRKLIKAIENTKRCFNIVEKIHASSLHGASSFTKFNVPGHVSTTSEERMCELSDVLFVVYSTRENKATFSLTQFKREYVRNRIDNNKFYIDLIQYALIKYRPIVNFSRYKILNDNKTLLYSANRPSITNYAVFYDDSLGININYYHPKHLNVNNVPAATSGRRLRRVTEFTGTYANVNHLNETEGEDGFENFFNSLLTFKIGEYIKTLNALTIKTLAEDGPEGFKEYIRNINDDELKNIEDKIIPKNNLLTVYFDIDSIENDCFKDFSEIDYFFENKRSLLDM